MKDLILKFGQFIIIVILCILLFNKCQKEKLVKHDTSNYTTVSSKKEALKVITVHDTIVKKFHDIKNITKVVQNVRVDTVKIVFKDSIPCIFERTGDVKQKEYSFDYKIDNNSANVINFKVTPDTLTIVDGSKRKWFLGKETNAVDVSHSNKYFYNSDVQHVEVKKRKQFYDTRLFNVSVGVIGGIFLVK